MQLNKQTQIYYMVCCFIYKYSFQKSKLNFQFVNPILIIKDT